MVITKTALKSLMGFDTMAKASNYILRQLFLALVFITLCLIFAIWLTQSLRLIDLIVNRGLPLSLFLYMSSLMLPTFLSMVLPLSLFAATLYTYNRLIMDSEIVVLRAAGVSPLRLSRPALVLGVWVALLGYFISLYLLPLSFREFKDLQFLVRNNYTSVLLQEGVFTNLTDDVTVFVRDRRSDGELLGIFVHDARIADRPVTMMAERGVMIKTKTGPRVVMINGNRQEVSKETGKLSLLYFDEYTLDMRSVDKSASYRWREARERYLPELFSPDMSQASNIQNLQKLKAEGHTRLVQPLYSLAFAMIALTFLLTGDFARRGQTLRLTAAALTILMLQSSSIGLSHLAARHSWAVPLMYANAIIPMVFCFAFLSARTKRISRRAARRAGPPSQISAAKISAG